MVTGRLQKQRKSMKQIFYGWYIVLGMLLVLLIHGGTGFYIFGIFYVPLNNEFGWDRSTVATAISLYIFIIAMTGPLIGSLTDKAGARKIITFGAAVASLTFLLLSRTATLWQFYLGYTVLGMAFSACGLIPANTLLSNWFVARRGLAIGIATAGISLGAILLTNAGGYILNTLGWRNTYLFLGILTGLLVVPYVLLVVKDRPEEIGRPLPDKEAGGANAAITTADSGRQDWPLQKAVKDPSLWLLLTAFGFVFINISAVLQFEVDYFIENGLSEVTAASILGLTGGAGGLGKIFFGYMADRTSPKTGMIASLAVQMLAILLLLHTGPAFVWGFAVIYGFSMGAQLALQPLLIGQFYGNAAFGTLLGLVAAAGAAGTAIGPLLAGHLRDAAVSYTWIFSGCIGCAGLALLATLLTRATRPLPVTANCRQ